MTPDRLDATFAALADPTRRAILARLASGEASVTELAEPFAMSQPAISKHLKVLERAGLISRGRDAQRRPRRLEATPLAEATEWLERYRRVLGGQFPAPRRPARRNEDQGEEETMSLLTDFKFALRSLARVKGLAITVVLTLALGIGANAAIFSVVRGVLLRPLVNDDEDRLIYIRQSAPGIGAENAKFSVPEIRDLRARVKTLSAFGDFSTIDFTMVGPRRAARRARRRRRRLVLRGHGASAGRSAACSTPPTMGRRRRARRC